LGQPVQIRQPFKPCFDAVYVAGQAAQLHNDARFAQTMHALWGG